MEYTKEQIETLYEQNKEAVKQYKEWYETSLKIREHMEEKIRKAVKKAGGPQYCSGIYASTPLYEPLEVYHYGSFTYKNKGFAILIDGTVVCHNGKSARNEFYPSSIINLPEEEMNKAKNYFNKIISAVEQETGYKVLNKTEYTIKQKVVDLSVPPNTEDEVLFHHPNAVVLFKGQNSYKGWDITDPWLIVSDNNLIRFFWCNTGHGGGYNHTLNVQKKDYSDLEIQREVQNFVDFLMEDTDNNLKSINKMLTKCFE